MRQNPLVLSLAFSLVIVLPAALVAQETPQYALSIYAAGSDDSPDPFVAAPTETEGSPGGYAVVREQRVLDLKVGSNSIDLHDMPRYLDATALSFRAVSDTENVALTAQNFEYDSISGDRLAERHLGHTVIVEPGNGSMPITGALVSNLGGLTLALPDGHITNLTEYKRVTYSEPPKRLAATPTLHWQIVAKRPGTQTIELVYPITGMAWRAEYSAWLSSGAECKLDFAGWADIANRSGTDFHTAHIKLISEPHHARDSNANTPSSNKNRNQANEETLSTEYRPYLVDSAVDLPNANIQRLALFPSQTVTCQRQYVFESTRLRASSDIAPITDRAYGGNASGIMRSTLAFRANHPLPSGRLRVLVDDAESAPEFIGEDRIAPSAANEPITIELGNTSDLKGERTQTDYQINKENHTLNENFAIRLSNRSAQAQSVVVREHLYRWIQWNIVQSSAKFEKRNADTIDFRIDVPANGATTLTYTVQYQWTASLN